MADAPKFALPTSGSEVVSKILHAYALCGDKPASLDDVAAKAGMNKTLLSANHGFLVGLGLVSGGRSKSLTDEGRALAIAIGHGLDQDEAAAWRKVLRTAPATRSVLEMIRVQKSVPSDALGGKIAQSLGEPNSSATKTGTKCLIEILTRSGMLRETDGKFSLSPDALSEAPPPSEATPPKAEQTLTGVVDSSTALPTRDQVARVTGTVSNIPIHVNIELHLPAASDQAVYDALFKSIRENLLS